MLDRFKLSQKATAGRGITDTHGPANPANVVLSIEDEDAYLRHLENTRAAYAPTNYFEQTVVDRIASITWRQARYAAIGMELHKSSLDLTGAGAAAFYQLRNPKALASLRSLFSDLRQLEFHQNALDQQFRYAVSNLRTYRKYLAPKAAAVRPKSAYKH